MAAVPESAGLVSLDDLALPLPDEVDASSPTEAICAVDELPLADGVADAVARFRRLLAHGRLAAA